MAWRGPSSPRGGGLDNKRPHESVDYISHNVASKRRDDKHVPNAGGVTTQGPTSIPLMPNLKMGGEKMYTDGDIPETVHNNSLADSATSDVSSVRSGSIKSESSMSMDGHTAPGASEIDAIQSRLSGVNFDGSKAIPIPGLVSAVQSNARYQPPPLGASPTVMAAAASAMRRAKAQSESGLDSGAVPVAALSRRKNGVNTLESANRPPESPASIQRQHSAPAGNLDLEIHSNANFPRRIPSGASFSVAVETRETRVHKNGSKYTAYRLSIVLGSNDVTSTPLQHLGPRSWKIWHRYSEFVAFRSELRKANLQVTSLPPKTWQSNFLDAFLDSRQAALAGWVAQLPSIFLISPTAENLISNFLTSTESSEKKDGSGDSLTLASPMNTPSPQRGKQLNNAESGNSNVSLMSAVLSGTSDTQRGEDVGDSKSSKPSKPTASVTMKNFEMLKVLGKGSYGKVILVRKRDGPDAGECYAMKVLKKRHVHQKRQVEHTKTERNVLATIKHPFIVKLHYAFQTGDKLHFVLDYASGGELFFHLQKHGRFPPKLALFYTAELTLAFGELHSREIVFRDLKPENVLIGGDGHVQLADFGLSKGGVKEPESGTRSFCGTPEYLAPEVLAREGHGFAVDWWGLGALLYEMLTGLPPWYSRDRQKMFSSIRNDPLVIPSYVAAEIQTLISGLLEKDPKKRLGGQGGDATEIQAHSIFRYVGWEQLYQKRVIPPWKPGDATGGGDPKSKAIETGKGGAVSNRDVAFSPDTSNFEDTFTKMPVQSVGSEGVLNNMLERTTRTSTFDGFSYVDDGHANALLAWGASRDAASRDSGNGFSSRGGSPRLSPSRSPSMGSSPQRTGGSPSRWKR